MMGRTDMRRKCSGISRFRDPKYSPGEQAVLPRYLRLNLAPAGAGARSPDYLYKSTFRETHYVRAGDDQVIKDSYVHEAQRITQALCNQLICHRRLSNF